MQSGAPDKAADMLGLPKSAFAFLSPSMPDPPVFKAPLANVQKAVTSTPLAVTPEAPSEASGASPAAFGSSPPLPSPIRSASSPTASRSSGGSGSLKKHRPAPAAPTEASGAGGLAGTGKGANIAGKVAEAEAAAWKLERSMLLNRLAEAEGQVKVGSILYVLRRRFSCSIFCLSLYTDSPLL